MTDPVVEIPFSGGIDQSTREEILDAAGSFVLLENVRQTKKGGATKRLGYRTLGNARLDDSSRTVGRRVFGAGDQICATDDYQLDAYVPSLERWVTRSQLPEAGFRYFDVAGASTPTGTLVVDTAAIGNYVAIAERLDDGVSVTVMDVSTGAVLSGPGRIGATFDVGEAALAACGGCFVLAVSDADTNTIDIRKFEITSAADIAAGWVVLDSFTDTDVRGDIVVVQRGITFAIAYSTSSGSSRLHVRIYDDTSQLQSVDLGVTTDTHTYDMSEGTDSTLWVCWSEGDGSSGRAIGLDAANIAGTPHASAAGLASVGGNTISHMTIVERGAGLATMTVEFNADVIGTTLVQKVKIAAGVAAQDGSVDGWVNAYVTGRPFYRDGRLYAWVSTTTFDDLVLGELKGSTSRSRPIRPVLAPIVRGLVQQRTGNRCRTAYRGGDLYAFAFSTRSTGLTTAPRAISIDFNDASRASAVPHHGSTFLSGGVTTVFDSSTAVESAFLCAPPSPQVDTSDAGSQTFTNGGRRYVAVYASLDAAGNLHVSGVSNPSASTGNITSKKILVSVAPLAITARAEGQVVVHLYATEDGGEEPYYHVASTVNDSNGIQPLEDGQLSVTSGALLYGSGNLPGTVQNGQPGGPQDHRAPPGLTCLTSYNGMLCGIAGNEVWHTAQAVYGEGVWWSPLFTAQFDEKPVALFAMDGTLYVLTSRGVYALTGDPPNDAGTQGGLSTPRRLGVERGCINPRSVVVTGAGAFYQSPRGYELFRAGAIEPIGDLVLDELEEFPHVTSAAFDATRGLVRITLAKSLNSVGLVDGYEYHPPTGEVPEYEVGGGRDLAFDLILGVWVSVDRKFGSSDDQPSQDAAIVNDAGTPRYAWIAADGTVYLEDPSTNLDHGSTWVTQRAETGWVHIAGLQGEQFIDRVLVLAKSATSHDLTVSLAFDYGDYSKTRTFTSDQIDALLREWLDVEVNPTTSQAVRVRLEDATPSGEGATVGTGEGATWVALTFNGQPHRGAKRTAGAQRSG